MSTAPSQPTSSRSKAGDGGDPSLDDGTLSEASGGEASDLLTKALLRRGLSDIQRTADRTNYAFTRLELVGHNIKNLEGDLNAYPEVRYVNLSSNELLDLSPLSVLPSLLSLVVSHNHLHSLDSLVATPHPHLQLLQADHNEIEHLLVASANPPKKHAISALATNFPSLFALTLSNNKLASLLRPEDNANTFAKHGHPTLQVLDLAFNQLTNLAGLAAFPELRVLNLQSNSLGALDGIQALRHLEKLNVTDNRLLSFTAELPRLAQLPRLTHLVISAGNPGLQEELEATLEAAKAAGTAPESSIANGVDLVAEILIILPSLLFLDGRRVTPTMRETADALKKERAQDAERRANEEAEAKKAAAAEEDEDKKQSGDEDEDAMGHHSNDDEGGDASGADQSGDMIDGGDMDQDDQDDDGGDD